MPADITMCQNHMCPLRDSCYRYRATPSKWQSYGQFEYDLYNGSCDDYIEIKEWKGEE